MIYIKEQKKFGGVCSFFTTWVADNCDLYGIMDVTWDAIWENGINNKPKYCVRGSRTVPCQRLIALGFISFYSIITTIIIIIAIYCFKIWKKR